MEIGLPSMQLTIGRAAIKPGAYQNIEEEKAVEKTYEQVFSSVNRSDATAENKKVWVD